METLPTTTTTAAADGNPGDCQAVAADSTTAVVEVCNVEQQSAAAPIATTTNEELQQHVSSTTAPTTTTTAKHGASPPTTTNPATNSNKLKSQQQQQQQQQQNAPTTSIKFHQFRAPQQFVKHKKSTSMLAKKNKTWNKRQNKCHLNKLQQQQQQQQQQNSCTLLAGGGITGVIGVDGANIGALPATKADLENIQNLKNQLGGSGGGGGGHHPYYHHQHHAQQQQHHHGGGGHRLGGGAGNGGGGGGGNTGNGILPCLCNLEKLGYGHGHLKQQLYKKMLAHRGHHHHVLCAGAAHNTLCGGTSACCLANGCSVQNGKDTASVNSHNSSNGGGGGGGGINQSLHYCCIRSKFFLPDKRIRKEVIIPPTKFLLGGNISDPLNLNSLQNEASNASSNNNTPATTPRQSPITTPPKVEVIIPPNIHDPLHLLDPVDSMEYEKQLTSPMKRKTNKSKHRHRKNRKPKRRRYESYNSTIMDEDLPPLAGGGGSTSSALANSTMSTEASSSNATATTLSLSLNSVENISEEHKENHNSPVVVAPINANLLLSTTTAITATTAEYVEKNTEILSPSGGGGGVGIGIQQQQQQSQHVASAATVGETSVAAVEMLHVRRTSERERASKDLRLDLNLCSGGTGVVVGISANNSNNNSASSSTCGSVGGGGGSGLGGGGRKRKISESSNSQKNKKFHRLDSMDKIVSPVVPQPGAWKRPPRLVVPTGARKASRRSTSISETDLLSPADETAKPLIIDTESNRGDTPDLNKMETTSDVGLGSPLSTISAATSVATAGEQDSMAGDTSVGEVITPITTTTTTISVVNAAEESVANATKFTATNTTIAQLTKTPKFRADGAKYQYGNYDHYPGFRHLNEFMDVRLQVFQRHMELFQNKDVLDIGCNVGHMTITVARNLAPKSILGLDIDKDLIARARRNLSMYVRIPAEAAAKPKEVSKIEATKTELLSAAKKTRRQKKKKKQQQQQQQQQPALSALHTHHHHYHHMLLLHHQHHLLQQQQNVTNKLHVDASELFPVSFPINYGPVPGVCDAAATPLTTSSTPGHPSAAASTSAAAAAGANTSAISSSSSKSKNDFPKNVFFRQTNYVLKDESQMNHDSQQYDLIMCLSVTKWIHLNFGDNGLKMAFKRMFNQLRPGGKLILEAQNWASYKKKKNLTETIYNNYRNIEFYPNKFHEYLLSPEVGFSHTYTLGVPRHLNKGFCRPIQLYAKGDYTPNHVRWSDAYYPQTPYEAYRGIYATMAPRSAGSASMVYPLLSSSRSQNYDTPHHPGGGVGGAGGGGGRSGSYSLRQTPMHQPTSQYYNPLETDSYLPSYDMEYLNHLYVFASPLYQTVWSPPASLRNSSSHTPLFGSVRDAELDGDGGSGSAGGGSYHRHVYPPNDDTSSPNASAGGAFNSIRDPDTDDSNQLPASSVHVYATNCESSSSPQVQHLQDSETIDEVGLLLSEASGDEQQHVGGGGGSVGGGANNCCGDSNEA